MLGKVTNQLFRVAPARLVARIRRTASVVGQWSKKHRWLALVIGLIIVAGVVGLIILATRGDKQVVQPSDNPVVAEYQRQLPGLLSAVDNSPNDVAARKNYAVALYATGDLNAAKTQYEKAVNLNEKDAIAWNNLGNTYRDLGKTDKAVDAYNKALASDPKAINTYVNLANLQLYTLNKAQDAIATYRKAQAQLPDNQQITLLLALAYEQAGDKSNAKQTLQTLLSQHPDNEAAKANLDRINE